MQKRHRYVYGHFIHFLKTSRHKIQCAIKKIGIAVQGFLSLLIHGMLSFDLKRFHIGICRHFSNLAMVYNTWCWDQQMKTQEQVRSLWPTCALNTRLLTREALLPPLFGDTRMFSVWYVVGFLLLVLSVSWQNYSVAWMAPPGRYSKWIH